MQCLCRPTWQPVFLIREIWQTLATHDASYCVRGDRARQATRRCDAGFTGMLQERLTTFIQVGKYLGSWPLLGWGVSSAPSPEGCRHLLVIQSKAGDDFIHSLFLSFIHKIRIKHLVLWLRQHWKQAAFEGAEGRRSTSTHHNPRCRLCLPGGTVVTQPQCYLSSTWKGKWRASERRKQWKWTLKDN